MTLTKTKLENGIWEGVMISTQKPNLTVTHLTEEIKGVNVHQNSNNSWTVQIKIPNHLIADGMQTFVIRDGDQTLNSFAIFIGEALSDDIRADVELLRAELDLLKQSFRRHCVETVITTHD